LHENFYNVKPGLEKHGCGEYGCGRVGTAIDTAYQAVSKIQFAGMHLPAPYWEASLFVG
jgi:hypothetical protein